MIFNKANESTISTLTKRSGIFTKMHLNCIFYALLAVLFVFIADASGKVFDLWDLDGVKERFFNIEHVFDHVTGEKKNVGENPTYCWSFFNKTHGNPEKLDCCKTVENDKDMSDVDKSLKDIVKVDSDGM